jgi:hypothetical protein
MKKTKKACDHIVGEFEKDYSEYELLRVSTLKEKYEGGFEHYFNYCPECGEKLNLK